jgi:hypothetical protein
VPEELGRRLLEIYQASNQRLAELVSFDPAAYGYAVG